MSGQSMSCPPVAGKAPYSEATRAALAAREARRRASNPHYRPGPEAEAFARRFRAKHATQVARLAAKAARAERVELAATARPARPAAARAPRRAPTRTSTRTAPRVDSGGDGPPSPPRAGQLSPVGAFLATQLVCLALFGIRREQWRTFLRKNGIPHTVRHRLIFARVADVLRALGLPDPKQDTPTAPDPNAWRSAALTAIQGGRK